MSAHQTVCKSSCSAINELQTAVGPVLVTQNVEMMVGTATTAKAYPSSEEAIIRLWEEQSFLTRGRFLPLRFSENTRTEDLSAAQLAEQKKKNQAAIKLLDSWLQEESDYDTRVWPQVKKAIEENRLSERNRFSD